jgi:hypothetical protein
MVFFPSAIVSADFTGSAESDGKLDRKERNQILRGMSDDEIPRRSG